MGCWTLKNTPKFLKIKANGKIFEKTSVALSLLQGYL